MPVTSLEPHAIRPFVQLSRQMQSSQAAAVRKAQQASSADFASAAAWTPYQLPEGQALFEVHRAAVLTLTLSAAAVSDTSLVLAVRPRLAAHQAPLSVEQLAAVTAACAETWPDPWVILLSSIPRALHDSAFTILYNCM